MRHALLTLCTLILAAPACDEPDADDLEDDAVDAAEDPGELGEDGFRYYKGVNGDVCTASKYNCKLRPVGGNRVATNDPDDKNSWSVAKGVPVRDGNGTIVGTNEKDRTTFNYGQKRTFDGEPYVFAVSTSNRSAGWMPLSSIGGQTSFAEKLGQVSAVGEGLTKIGCYQIKNSHDTSMEEKKVVYAAQTAYERAGDYLPKIRENGKRSANLTFNTPGFSLGGVAIDHFPAGTKFQRYDVPTDKGPASVEIPLYVWDPNMPDPKDKTGKKIGCYCKKDGTMKFIYGYIIAATGTKRNGWMALDALQVSSGCP